MPSFAKLTYFKAGRKTPIDITEQSGTDLTDYQVEITLDGSWDGWDKVKPDGSDIFILDDLGNPLYYWIEEFDYVNTKAIIFVKIPSLPSLSSKRIYLYYGVENPYTAYRDGESVFDFFDDFSVDLSKWSIIDGTWEIVNGELRHLGAGAPRFIQTSTYQITDGVVYFKSRFSVLGVEYCGLLTRIQDINNLYHHADLRPGDNSFGMYLKLGGTYTTLASVGYTWQTDIYYRVKAILYGSKLVAEVNGTQISATDTNFASGYIGFRARVPSGYYWYIDYVLVKKYIEPEPSIVINPSILLTKDIDFM